MHGCEACNKRVHAARGYRRHRLGVFRAALGQLLARAPPPVRIGWLETGCLETGTL